MLDMNPMIGNSALEHLHISYHKLNQAIHKSFYLSNINLELKDCVEMNHPHIFVNQFYELSYGDN
jgi:hypothetical protein